MPTTNIYAVVYRDEYAGPTKTFGLYSDERIASAVTEALNKAGSPSREYFYKARTLDTTDTSKPAIEWDDLPTRAKQVIRVVMHRNRNDQRGPTPTEIAQWLRGKDPYLVFLRQPGCGMQTATQIKNYVAQGDQS
jgi:hypothetical protein